MIEGIILCFSKCRSKAHIWCLANDAPLCLAYREDFPALWDSLEIGTPVKVYARSTGALLRAVDLRLHCLADTFCA